jgi:hypothetical protein
MINKVEGVSFHHDYLDGLGLKINNFYKEFKIYPNIHTSNYTLVGLRKESSTRIQGGAKHYTDYTGLIEGSREVIIRKSFEYIYADTDPTKIGVWIEHAWYTYTGEKGLIKVEFKPQTIGEMSNIRRKHRAFVRESLIALGGNDPTLSIYINILVEHYKVQANEFVDLGKAQAWKDAILVDMDVSKASGTQEEQQIFGILNSQITHEGRTQIVAAFILEDIEPHIF